jgi:hypothetical protein
VRPQQLIDVVINRTSAAPTGVEQWSLSPAKPVDFPHIRACGEGGVPSEMLVPEAK